VENINRTKIEWANYTWNPITGWDKLMQEFDGRKPDFLGLKDRAKEDRIKLFKKLGIYYGK
jgi:hypothetical protein